MFSNGHSIKKYRPQRMSTESKQQVHKRSMPTEMTPFSNQSNTSQEVVAVANFSHYFNKNDAMDSKPNVHKEEAVRSKHINKKTLDDQELTNMDDNNVEDEQIVFVNKK